MQLLKIVLAAAALAAGTVAGPAPAPVPKPAPADAVTANDMATGCNPGYYYCGWLLNSMGGFSIISFLRSQPAVICG
jgi:hypothetical protein